MTCFESLYKRLVNELNRNGYRITEVRYKWGVELTIECHGEITTVDLYIRGNDLVTIEVSSISNLNGDFNVDIFDCNCDEKGIESCLNEIKSSLNSFIFS